MITQEAKFTCDKCQESILVEVKVGYYAASWGTHQPTRVNLAGIDESSVELPFGWTLDFCPDCNRDKGSRHE